MQFMDIKNGRFYLGDCLEVMKEIPDGVIDMLLVDLPYGTTKCKWDSIIPFDKLWEQYNRICKENAAMVLFGVEPFSSFLRMSNIENYKYDWYWDKVHGANFAQANKRPLKNVECISVFYKKPCLYNPQKTKNPKGEEKRSKYAASKQKDCFIGQVAMNAEFSAPGEKYESDKLLPKSILTFSRTSKPIHPTQKPVALFEYLIRTYTNEGDLVLDNTAGSGTTAIAAENTRRKWVCIERNEEYATKAVERIWNHEATPQQASEVKIDSNVPIPEGE